MREMSRLITAAVVNQAFRNLLLANPAAALSKGYRGELFELPWEEQVLLLSIRATSLEDLASQLAEEKGERSSAIYRMKGVSQINRV